MIRALVALVAPALAWLGLVQGIDGAYNLLMLAVWAMLVPISLLTLHPKVLEGAAATPAPPATPWTDNARRLCWWSAILLCGWHGLWATTTAMLVCTALAWSNNRSVEELRRKRAAAQVVQGDA